MTTKNTTPATPFVEAPEQKTERAKLVTFKFKASNIVARNKKTILIAIHDLDVWVAKTLVQETENHIRVSFSPDFEYQSNEIEKPILGDKLIAYIRKNNKAII